MKRLLLLFFLIFAAPAVSAAMPDFDMGAFGRIPVLQDGRLKPLDSLARVMLKRIYNSDRFEGRPAVDWAAFLFFDPEAAMKAPMFYIQSAHAAEALGLEPHPDQHYSFQEIAFVLPTRTTTIRTLMEQDKSTYTPDQAEIVRVYGAVGDFAELIGSFSLLLPIENVDDALRARLHVPSPEPVTLFDVHKERVALQAALQEIVKQKGEPGNNYTPEERALVQLVSRDALQEQLDQDNALVRVIPPAWGGEEWLSPWGVLKASNGSPLSATLFSDWRALAVAYRGGKPDAWNTISHDLLQHSLSALPPLDGWRLMLEYYYHALALLPLAAIAYGLGLGLVLAGRAGRVPALGRAIILIGLALQGTAILMRMLILMRPPVSTLYESLLFVSFLVMAAAAWLGAKGRIAALIAAGLTALMLLLSSWVFAGDGDTLGVLVAVLNTNFWLATHVVCITTGYGTALVAGAIAHIYLFRAAILRATEETLGSLFHMAHRAALVALCFTATGTMLGGIWADQSWGRFWGWDPKENGALLIVLWLIWLLHGRVARQLSAFSFAALLALVNIVVALAWIGVNLLSVGLHSYGFTDEAATSLIAFCGAEVAYVLVMTAWRALGIRNLEPGT